MTESVGEQLRAVTAAPWSSVGKSSPFILLLSHHQYVACTLRFKTAIKFYLVAHLIFRSGEKEKKSINPFSFLLFFCDFMTIFSVGFRFFFLFCVHIYDRYFGLWLP